MEEEKPPKPTIVLLLTDEQAEALTTVIAHYLMHKSRHGLNPTQTTTLVKDLQKDLIEQAHMPMLHPGNVEGIGHLMTLNRFRPGAIPDAAPRSLEEQQARRSIELDAQCQLQRHNIPVHIDGKTHFWKFGTYLGSTEE